VSARALAAVGLALALAACRREERRFVTVAAESARPAMLPETSLQPGVPGAPSPSGVPPSSARGREALGNAWAISQGQQLYGWFNCAGCHAHGGGDIGPPLMDAQWIYGGAPEDVYRSIVGGRPGGMPAFGGKIPEQQVWQLVAYVLSMSGNVSMTARSAREDALPSRPSDVLRSTEPPHPGSPQPKEPR
jgi:cytochrome c oxidase cbb3-type subunit 3